MKNTIRFIFCLILTIATSICKSQTNKPPNTNQKTLISEIRDSVICKKENNIFKMVYSLPKLSLNDKVLQKTINNLIYQQIRNNGELFEFLENDSLKATTEEAIKLIFEKTRANCTPSYYGFGEINVHFDTFYNKNEFVSMEVYRESFFANYQQSIIPINLNLKANEVLNINNIIKFNKKELLIRKIDSILQKTIEDNLLDYKENDLENYLDAVNNIKSYYKGFNLEDLDFFILTSKDNLDGLQFIYSLGYPQVIKASEPTFDLFLSFEKLKPYLTIEFKKQLGF